MSSMSATPIWKNGAFLKALQIAGIYVIISSAWIIFSDSLVHWLAGGEAERITAWQNFKGLFFVVVSAVIILCLVWAYGNRVHESEKQLRESQTRLRFLLDNLDEATWIWDAREGRLSYVSSGCRKLLGHPVESIREEPGVLKALLPAEFAEEADKVVARIRAGEEVTWNCRIRHPSRGERWMEIRSKPVRDERGELLRAEGIVRDNTTEIRAEIATAKALVAQVEADEARTRLFSNLSHEMRTPLNAVVGFAALLAESDDKAERAEHLARIDNAANELLRMVDQLIAASLESGDRRGHPAPIATKRFFEDAITAHSEAAAAKGVRLEMRHADNIPGEINADPDSLAEVVNALLSNAVKFSHSGTVRLELGLETPARGVEVLRLRVADEGPGIEPAFHDAMFEPFWRAPDARVVGGLGLGLYVCKKLCESMGATIDVHSQPGRGSEFIVTVPLQSAVAAGS